MGRHQLAANRGKPPLAMVVDIVAAVAVSVAAGASAHPLAVKESDNAGDAGLCCARIVAAASALTPPTLPADQSGMRLIPAKSVSRTVWRVVDTPRVLPIGVAPERGLQVRTILAARSISAAFPEIFEIGGVRPDALRWHPDGLALDVMIPDPGSAAGIALGNQIVAFALQNAERFGLQDAIWRGVYYSPGGPRAAGYGHYDHVHITTTGGGYPTGGETYLR